MSMTNYLLILAEKGPGGHRGGNKSIRTVRVNNTRIITIGISVLAQY